MVVRKKSEWAQDAHINWELNERISLSSSSSSSNNNNNSIGRKKKLRDEQHHTGTGLRNGTPVQRRWNIAKDKLDRTNDTLVKRLSVIQELNRKILANYDKMHETRSKTKEHRWKPLGDDHHRHHYQEQEQEEEGTRPVSLVKQQRRDMLMEKRRRTAMTSSSSTMTFQRRAGGEWSLPSQRTNYDDECTLLRKKLHRPNLDPADPDSPPLQVVEVQIEQEEEEEEEADESESSALRQLNEAIDRFEEDSSKSNEVDNAAGSASASGSAASSSSGAALDSSWDSGVGGDLFSDRQQLLSGCQQQQQQQQQRTTGWLRVHTGIESSLVYLTHETTAADVCRDMLLADNLALFVQVSCLLLLGAQALVLANFFPLSLSNTGAV